MTLPLQVILADDGLAPAVARELATRAGGAAVWTFHWDDQPEVEARAARHAREILETTGARGEGGFARIVVGAMHGETGGEMGAEIGGPAPIVTLRLGLEGLGLTVPEQIGPRRIADADRRVLVAHLVGWISELAGGERAREALMMVAEAIGERAHALAAVGRFPVVQLERQLVRRMVQAVATRVHGIVRAGADATVDAPSWPDGLTVDAQEADALGARVHEEGPALARARAAQALAAAEGLIIDVRAAIDRAFADRGLAALTPLRAMVTALSREAEARARAEVSTAIVAAEAPARAALDAAEAAMAAASEPGAGLWPLEVATALGGASVSAVAVGPLLTVNSIGGGAGVVGAAALAAWGAAAAVTRVAQAVSRRRTRRALADAQEGFVEAWRAAARAWFEPIATRASRRAAARLARALEAERSVLEAIGHEVEALVKAAEPSAAGAPEEAALTRAIDLEAAHAVLAQPAEPMIARVDAEVRRGDWRHARDLLSRAGLDAAVRATYAARGVTAEAGLPLASRTDLADALRGAVTSTLGTLRAELVRWVPEGLPVRRYIALPPALGDAVPELARADERQASTRDAWVVALWRPA